VSTTEGAAGGTENRERPIRAGPGAEEALLIVIGAFTTGGSPVVSARHGRPFNGSHRREGTPGLTPHTNSSSNSDSDSNHKLQVNLKQNDTNNNTSQRVLKLGSLKSNPGLFWNVYENRVSPDSETFSEPELPQEIPEKRRTGRAQRSASIPDIHYTSERSLGDMPHPCTYTSPVEGLLERAKVRVHREGGRNRKEHDMKTLHPPHSPSSFSAPLSPSPSDGDQEVELMRHRVPSVSQGWREQLVDGDAEDKKYR